MAFMDPNKLKQIFGQGTLFGGDPAPAPSTNQERLIQALAGIGAGMTGTQGNFAQQLGGGAAGMMQADGQFKQQQAQQQQQALQKQQMGIQQQQADRQQQQFEAEQARNEAWQKQLFGDVAVPDFMASVDGRAGGAQASPASQRGQVSSRPTQYRLGSISEQYESSGGGVGTVSTGQDDPGGVSYGRHQISSNAGTMDAFLQSPEGKAFSTRFVGMEPGTPEFTRAYDQLVADQGSALDEAQRGFLMRTHFQPVAEQAQQLGIPVDNPAVAEALYSMSVQHSGEGNVQILNDAIARLPQGANEEQLIDALYDARGAYADQFVSEAAGSGRYERERRNVKRLLGDVGQQGRDAVAQRSQQAAPQSGGLVADLNLTGRERQILAIMGPEQQMEFITQRAGMGGDKQPDKLVMAERIAATTGRDVGDILAEMEGIGQYTEADDATAAHQTKLLQIDALMDADPTLSRDDAYNQVFGRTRGVTDPITGEFGVFDQITGERVGTPTQVPERPATTTPEDEVDVERAFGVGAVWDNAVNTAYDVLGAELPRPEVEQAITRVKSLGIQGDVLLSEQFSGRVSNQLLDMIGELKASPASVFQGPSRGRARFEEMRRLVERDLERNKYMAQDPRQGKTTQRDARLAEEKLTQYKAELDSVLGAWGSSTAAGADLTPEDEELINRWAE